MTKIIISTLYYELMAQLPNHIFKLCDDTILINRSQHDQATPMVAYYRIKATANDITIIRTAAFRTAKTTINYEDPNMFDKIIETINAAHATE